MERSRVVAVTIIELHTDIIIVEFLFILLKTQYDLSVINDFIIIFDYVLVENKQCIYLCSR